MGGRGLSAAPQNRLPHDGAWVVRERNEYIWLLSRDEDDWDAREKAYYASPERAAVTPDPAQYIAKSEKWLPTPVLPRAPR